MSDPVEMMDDIPFPAQNADNIDDITLYGKLLNANDNGRIRAIIYGYCFQGHCYRLSLPAVYLFNAAAGDVAKGCGYQDVLTAPGGVSAYTEWSIESTARITRIEQRKGSAAELLLDFNLPGRSPASMSYSARVVIGSRAGRVHE